MTRDEILALKPGSGLDVLVAEKTLRFPAPAYSSDIRAAWELVDELHERGMWLSINTLTNVIHVNADSDRPYLRSVTSRPMRLVALSVGESVPHSICLAFLLAMEEQPMG